MGLSSNTVIHFTHNLTGLRGILQHTFKVNYCRETLIATKSGKSDFLIPVVSFCDIPFSQILSHIDNYGKYGIGLSKQWAEAKGLNPVLYVDKNSTLANNFYENLFRTVKSWGKTFEDFNPENKNIFDIVRYMKNYQGDLVRRKKIIKDYRFSDEREWRYVLPLSSPFPMVQNCKDKTAEQIKYHKDKLNKEINEYLTFRPDDINYIIIELENQRDSIIQAISLIKGVNHSESTVTRLKSRIISVEQIGNDF